MQRSESSGEVPNVSFIQISVTEMHDTESTRVEQIIDASNKSLPSRLFTFPYGLKLARENSTARFN
jgi:hypothetical protein